jgi:hypothetical protein
LTQKKGNLVSSPKAFIDAGKKKDKKCVLVSLLTASFRLISSRMKNENTRSFASLPLDIGDEDTRSLDASLPRLISGQEQTTVGEI